MTLTFWSQEALEFTRHAAAVLPGDVGHYLLGNAAIVIFLCLAIGYWVGKIKIGSFNVGATVGTLLAGLLISLALASYGRFEISGLVKTIFFSLFIFSIGYEVGPSFFNSLKSSGVKIIIFSVFFAVVAFATAYIVCSMLHIEAGEAAGIIAGALTQSAVLGTADSSLKEVLSGTQLAQAQSNMAVAYALTYVFGTAGVIIFIRNIVPALCGVNLKEATKQKIEAIHYKEASAGDQTVSLIKARAFVVDDKTNFVGKTVADLEAHHNNTLTVEKLIRGGQEVPPKGDTVLQSGDRVTFMGSLASMVDVEKSGAQEILDAQSLSLPLVKKTIFLTQGFSQEVLKNLTVLGIYTVSATRNGSPLPEGTPFAVGDQLVLAGPPKMVAQVQKQLGYAKDTGDDTDVSFLSLGIVVGLLIGAISINIARVPITLGSGGGALFAGLFFGWYQSKHQNKGLLPAATRWFLKSVGLNLFIAIVGLSAGADFLSALKSMGVSVLLVSAVISLVPHFISVFFGKYVLHMDPVDICGSLTGAGTITAGLNGLVEETNSSVFALSYTPAYAAGNILLTVMGPLIVALLK